jgi:effector-binding domain-containing protein
MIKKLSILACTLALACVACGGKPKPVEKPAEPTFKVAVENIDSMYVASLAKVGPYTGIGSAFGELMAWIGKNKIVPTDAPYGVYYDDPSKVNPDSTKYAVCILVPAGTKGDNKVKVEKQDPIQAAVTLYVGPYEKLSATYAKLAEWIAANKYIVNGPAREYYLNDPTKVPADSLQTKIVIPVTTVE